MLACSHAHCFIIILLNSFYICNVFVYVYNFMSISVVNPLELLFIVCSLTDYKYNFFVFCLYFVTYNFFFLLT